MRDHNLFFLQKKLVPKNQVYHNMAHGTHYGPVPREILPRENIIVFQIYEIITTHLLTQKN